MPPTVSMTTARITMFTLTIAIVTLSTSAVQSARTSGTTCQHPTMHSTVKTIVTPGELNPGHDNDKAATCSIYQVEVTNHITISQGSQIVATDLRTGNTNDAVNATTIRHYMRSDYKKYDGIGSYKLHESPRTWPEAKKICEEEGAHLLIINSEAEEEVIKKVMVRHRRVFVGFRYLRDEDSYETVLGKPLNSTGYVNWDKDAESGDSGELCGAVWFTGEIVNVDCNDDFAFICELPA